MCRIMYLIIIIIRQGVQIWANHGSVASWDVFGQCLLCGPSLYPYLFIYCSIPSPLFSHFFFLQPKIFHTSILSSYSISIPSLTNIYIYITQLLFDNHFIKYYLYWYIFLFLFFFLFYIIYTLNFLKLKKIVLTFLFLFLEFFFLAMNQVFLFYYPLLLVCENHGREKGKRF